MKNNKVYILTAVHNDLKDTKVLLKSVFDQTFENFEVFLVDDGSTDGTTKFVSRKYPKVKIIKGNGSLWWTGSLNLGLKSIINRAGDNDYVWIINNDCYFSSNTINIFYKFAMKHPRSIIGSYVIDSKTKKVWDCGVKIDWSNLTFSKAKEENFLDGSIDALSTKGTLYPTGVFREIGIFDQKHFPHYFSDYEFSIRAKRSGYSLFVCSQGRIYNRVERTGFGEINDREDRFGNLFKVLFSKRSKVNLQVQINLVRLICPKEYRLKNYIRLLLKMFKRLWINKPEI